MGKIRNFLKNLSIRKSFMLYMLVFLLIAAFFSSVAVNWADLTKSNALLDYTKEGGELVSADGDVISYTYVESQLPQSLQNTINTCDFFSWFSIPAIFTLSIIAAATLFYRNKLKTPIDLLSRASKDIAGNNLNFQIGYDSRDEMGALCESFEKMRSTLDGNNREMWRAVEERKRLNAAFAHDLRTPLTVLRGYADFLGKYLPDDKLTKDKVISTVATLGGQITRLESYVETMVSLQKLEEIEPVLAEIRLSALRGQFRDSAEIICHGKEVTFSSSSDSDSIRIDAEIVTQVFENLISNASRWARQCIGVRLDCTDNVLKLLVSDDGDGFSEEALQKAAEPFYRGDAGEGHQETDQSHFGMGLHICRVLCEKHGGGFVLSNREAGGANIEAIFLITI